MRLIGSHQLLLTDSTGSKDLIVSLEWVRQKVKSHFKIFFFEWAFYKCFVQALYEMDTYIQ